MNIKNLFSSSKPPVKNAEEQLFVIGWTINLKSGHHHKRWYENVPSSKHPEEWQKIVVEVQQMHCDLEDAIAQGKKTVFLSDSVYFIDDIMSIQGFHEKQAK